MSLVAGSSNEYLDPFDDLFGGSQDGEPASELDLPGIDGEDIVPGGIDSYKGEAEVDSGGGGESALAQLKQAGMEAGEVVVGIAVLMTDSPVEHFPDGLPPTRNTPHGYCPELAHIALDESYRNFAGYGEAILSQYG